MTNSAGLTDETVASPKGSGGYCWVLTPQALHDLRALDEFGNWESLGQDPAFLLVTGSHDFPRGWVKLDFRIAAGQGAVFSPKLYVDTGSGFSEAESYLLPPLRNNRIEAFILLPEGVRAVRFDPHDMRAVFSLGALNLQEVTSIRADAYVLLASDKVIANPREKKYRADLLARLKESLPGRLVWPLRGLVPGVASFACAFRRRRRIMFDALPVKDLAALSTPGHWEATGHDPYFILRARATRTLTAGWVRAAFYLHSENKTLLAARLYHDTGAGFSEGESQALPYPVNGHIDAVIFLPKGIRALRFDPHNQPVVFRVETLSLKEIGRLQARLHLALPILRDVVLSPRRYKAIGARAYAHWRISGFRGLRAVIVDQFSKAGQHRSYVDWIDQFDRVLDSDRKAITAHIDRLAYRPRISVIMPVYNPPRKWLQQAIESVRNQLYPDWELCIADDCSPEPHVRKLLEEFRDDPRIKVVYRTENGHISMASNSALALATGEFIALLDHDDELPEHALYMVAAELNRFPDTDLIYSDEDKIDEFGQRFDAYFKPDWNPDLFCSQNAFSHLGVYRTSLVRQSGLFRKGYEGSQDYDLYLRCAALTDGERIRHIPHILYHWRSVGGSTAVSIDNKTYALEAGINALRHHFQGVNPDIQVEHGKFLGAYRVRYPLPAVLPLVSLIIPTRDGFELLRKCISSILTKTLYANYEVIVVDNQSTDPLTLAYFKELRNDGRVRVLSYNQPFNFSAINNFAVRHAKGSVIGLINNDIEVINPEWLDEMVAHALRPEVGAVGAKLLYPDGSVQHGGIVLGVGGVGNHLHQHHTRESPGYFGRAAIIQSLSAVTAACLLVRLKVFEQVGGLDEKNLAVAFNDIDLCLKIRDAGYRNVWTPYAELYHHESVSRGADDTPVKRARFVAEVEYMQERWGDALKEDPYYSPNLTLKHENHESLAIAWPPRRRSPWLEKHDLPPVYAGGADRRNPCTRAAD